VTVDNWQDKYTEEIDTARSARLQGNEGKSRVCARRAAGIVITEFLTRSGDVPSAESSYDLLRLINAKPGLPAEVYQSASRLLLRVNIEYKLPDDVDLIVETERLREQLLGG
jgi:predicted Rossmann fold nucleotide-binding protein DprA/Smf involved in DNA uptake